MADLLNELPANTYKSLLNIGTENNQTVDSTLRNIEDGRGNTSALSLSTTTVKVLDLEIEGEIIGGTFSSDSNPPIDGGTYNTE